MSVSSRKGGWNISSSFVWSHAQLNFCSGRGVEQCENQRREANKKSKGYLFWAGVAGCQPLSLMLWQRLSRGVGNLCRGNKGQRHVCPDWRLSAWRSWGWPHYRWGILCDWLEMHLWLSLLGPELEVGPQIREAVSCSSGPSHLGRIVTQAIA